MYRLNQGFLVSIPLRALFAGFFLLFLGRCDALPIANASYTSE
ncbi:hypothetical protein BFV94_4561 [Alteromonas macleodii]|uniref:Lipoprotein n=1 Tax=Alteromonas macleodii TaxID=28108 RepID=A0AB36FMY8_ALTMA|nr:hypothetical protein BFV93_4778 [Alteromonas macleodii]OES24812.1 hypothetical protein BFV95_4571 [Alteromonas macleodii]OES25090.1 hypothetical protein BFV94_4561 [Alteromonas macleodii]OES39133.1 hypothetical protein BFV96_4281 [Alteromonas macleodii]